MVNCLPKIFSDLSDELRYIGGVDISFVKGHDTAAVAGLGRWRIMTRLPKPSTLLVFLVVMIDCFYKML